MTTELRVTRQIAEVLAVGIPDLRVTRQIVEVFGRSASPARASRAKLSKSWASP